MVFYTDIFLPLILKFEAKPYYRVILWKTMVNFGSPAALNIQIRGKQNSKMLFSSNSYNIVIKSSQISPHSKTFFIKNKGRVIARFLHFWTRHLGCRHYMVMSITLGCFYFSSQTLKGDFKK